MRFLDDNPTPDQLLQAVARNHEQMWIHGARLRGGEVHRGHRATWIHTPGPPGEVVIPFPGMAGTRASEQLDAILQSCRLYRPPRQIGCWSLAPHKPPALGARLLARGFEWGWQPHWMWLDLRNVRADHPAPEHLRIDPAEEVPLAVGHDLPYFSPEDAAYWQAEAMARPRRVWRFLARLNGQLVGLSSLFLTTGRLGVAGIYGCGVVPAVRGQGIGTTVTLAACRRAKEMGCHHALLNATPMGEPVYRRIGFTSIGHGQTWWLHRPLIEAPPPPEVQIRFVEAIGTGDIAALTALRDKLQPPMLDAILPCGMTPLQIAAR